MFTRRCLYSYIFGAVLLFSTAVYSQIDVPRRLEFKAGDYYILNFGTESVRKVFISPKDIADVTLISPHEVALRALSEGEVTLTLWSRKSKYITLVTVNSYKEGEKETRIFELERSSSLDARYVKDFLTKTDISGFENIGDEHRKNEISSLKIARRIPPENITVLTENVWQKVQKTGTNSQTGQPYTYWEYDWVPYYKNISITASKSDLSVVEFIIEKLNGKEGLAPDVAKKKREYYREKLRKRQIEAKIIYLPSKYPVADVFNQVGIVLPYFLKGYKTQYEDFPPFFENVTVDPPKNRYIIFDTRENIKRFEEMVEFVTSEKDIDFKKFMIAKELEANQKIEALGVAYMDLSIEDMTERREAARIAAFKSAKDFLAEMVFNLEPAAPIPPKWRYRSRSKINDIVEKFAVRGPGRFDVNNSYRVTMTFDKHVLVNEFGIALELDKYIAEKKIINDLYEYLADNKESQAADLFDFNVLRVRGENRGKIYSMLNEGDKEKYINGFIDWFKLLSTGNKPFTPRIKVIDNGYLPVFEVDSPNGKLVYKLRKSKGHWKIYTVE